MRIVVFRIDRRGRKVETSAIGRDDEIDLVDFGQALGCLDVLARVGLVIIFDDLDHHLLATDIQPAGRIDLLRPKLDIRPLGDSRAAGKRTGLRRDLADLDHVSRLRRNGQERRRCGNGRGFEQSLQHGFPPRTIEPSHPVAPG